jgi:spermidine synthase
MLTSRVLVIGDFVLAKREKFAVEQVNINVDTKFLTNDVLAGLTTFGKDIDQHMVDEKGNQIQIEVNTLFIPHVRCRKTPTSRA